MHCPFCQNPQTKVLDTRVGEDGYAIRRRRECLKCHKRFTTQETIVLSIIKHSGATEPFDRKKVISGVRRACQGRNISDEALNRLGQQVEENLRARGQAEIRSEEVGKAILPPLRDLDVVAYLRFASVYRHFDSLDDYEKEIDSVRRYQEEKRHEGEEQ